MSQPFKFEKIEATIAISTALTGEINLGTDGVLQAIEIPSSWTTAGITFEASTSDDAGGTYRDVYDADGTEVASAAAADRFISVNPDIFAGARWLKIRSGTAGTPVNQAAARTINIRVERRRG